MDSSECSSDHPYTGQPDGLLTVERVAPHEPAIVVHGQPEIGGILHDHGIPGHEHKGPDSSDLSRTLTLATGNGFDFARGGQGHHIARPKITEDGSTTRQDGAISDTVELVLGYLPAGLIKELHDPIRRVGP